MDVSANLAPTKLALLQSGCIHTAPTVSHGICKACVACEQLLGLGGEGTASKAGLITSDINAVTTYYCDLLPHFHYLRFACTGISFC